VDKDLTAAAPEVSVCGVCQHSAGRVNVLTGIRGLRGQQVGLRHHADDLAVIVNHGQPADPVPAN
jgi:hypothetical protein